MMAYRIESPGNVRICFLFETGKLEAASHDYAVMNMVRHNAQRQHSDTIPPCNNAVISEIHKIITHTIKEQHPILCSLVAVVQDRGLYLFSHKQL